MIGVVVNIATGVTSLDANWFGPLADVRILKYFSILKSITILNIFLVTLERCRSLSCDNVREALRDGPRD